MIKAVLLDLSGVLYDGTELIPGAREAVARLQASGLKVRFVTNTSQKSRATLLEHLRGLGFEVGEGALFTAVDAAREWLRERGLRPYCLVHENIAAGFDVPDQGEPDAVLIADAAEGFTYERLNRALELCLEGAPLVGVGYNRYYRSGGRMLLDAGAFIRAVEFAADVEATIVGKPSAEFFHRVLASAEVQAGDALMVGDDVFGDVEGALKAGLRACLVRTGKYRRGDEGRISGDFRVVDSVVEAAELAVAAAAG
ncbi:MAG: TIGR01458 family HAD-type hydrolase [Halioglobus sp.]